EHPERIGEIIADLGGVDICFGGLGINGHIAFNEPENVNPKEYAQRPTRVLRIDERTRTVNGIGDLGGRVDDMPHYCITVGMREILSARKIRMYCFRKWHKAVVMRAAFGETDSLFPVTLTQNHPDAAITFAAIPIAD
ncbi:MAG: glucosamine-6-phosphate isomerase, partial [Oscillospiraceae bacterium]